MVLNERRLTDPITFSMTEIVDACERQGELVVQFSRPETYNPMILGLLNEVCQAAQERLQVRFFGHYGTQFDARCLRHIPEARNLALDGLSSIIHQDEVGRLSNLKRLSFGVFELDQPDFLTTIKLSGLERLTLGENRKRNFDLFPLAECGSLTKLFIQGHSKGVAAIASLHGLQELSLSAYGKDQSLNFIAKIPNLKTLRLILGGRTDIDDLSSISLEKLNILRVRGLANLGDLARLPALLSLRVEDQLQLARLDLSGSRLERLSLVNCKKLAELQGLEMQDRLQEFHASRVALDLEALRDRDWSPATRSVTLYSGSEKWDKATQARLAARGLGEKGGLWP